MSVSYKCWLRQAKKLLLAHRADLISAASDILACCTFESRAALLACSRQLRFLAQIYTKVITIDTLSGSAFVCNDSRPSLALVVCQEKNSTSSPVYGGKLAVVALLMLCDSGTADSL